MNWIFQKSWPNREAKHLRQTKLMMQMLSSSSLQHEKLNGCTEKIAKITLSRISVSVTLVHPTNCRTQCQENGRKNWDGRQPPSKARLAIYRISGQNPNAVHWACWNNTAQPPPGQQLPPDSRLEQSTQASATNAKLS